MGHGNKQLVLMSKKYCVIILMRWENKWSECNIQYHMMINKISKQPINSLSALFMALWVYYSSDTDNKLIEQKLIIFNFLSSTLAHSTYNSFFIFLDNESMSSTVILYTYNNISKQLGCILGALYIYLKGKKIEFDTRFGIITGLPLSVLLVNKRMKQDDLIRLLVGCLCHYLDKQCRNTNMKFLYLHAWWHILAGIAFTNILNYKDKSFLNIDNDVNTIDFEYTGEHF